MSEKLIHQMNMATGGDATQTDAIVRYLKDVMPASGRGTGPFLYENGPFSLLEGDVFSSVVTGGSALLQWIPTRLITDRFKPVNHLGYVAPANFDGSQTYADWLAENGVVDECGYGPTTTWNGFAWQASGGSFSWRTQMMKPYEDGGMRYYENMPIYTVRGQAGIPLSSDREWAIARLFIVMQQHLDYVIKHGDATNSNMEWDGLDTILRPGYVQARLIGPGNPTWANPEIVNGANLTITQVLTQLRGMVRRILNRANARQWEIAPNDMAIFMPSAMWDNIAEHVASGAMFRFINTYGFSGDVSMRDFLSMYNQIRQGGLGFGTINIDGRDVPVLVDHSLGYSSTIGSDTPAITGDIYVLTRRANGINLLEQHYVDWRQLDYVTTTTENYVNLQQGFVRAGYVVEANKCYYYYAEMAGRVMSYMQPMQGVIRNVTIPTLVENEVQGANFYSPDFYAYGGRRGGQGDSLL